MSSMGKVSILIDMEIAMWGSLKMERNMAWEHLRPMTSPGHIMGSLRMMFNMERGSLIGIMGVTMKGIWEMES